MARSPFNVPACAALLVLLLGACGSGGSAGGHGGGGGAGGGAGTGGGSGAGTGGGSGAGGGAATGGNGATGGGPCSATSCGSNEFCSTCGPGAGRCFSRPLDCIGAATEQIVCGCDGKLYMNSCEANGSGVDFQGIAFCPTPPGTFRCGTRFCTQGTQYCERWSSTPVPPNGTPYIYAYTCGDLAAGCDSTAPTCACVTRAECGDCTVSADGFLIALCHLAQ